MWSLGLINDSVVKSPKIKDLGTLTISDIKRGKLYNWRAETGL